MSIKVELDKLGLIRETDIKEIDRDETIYYLLEKALYYKNEDMINFISDNLMSFKTIYYSENIRDWMEFHDTYHDKEYLENDFDIALYNLMSKWYPDMIMESGDIAKLDNYINFTVEYNCIDSITDLNILTLILNDRIDYKYIDHIEYLIMSGKLNINIIYGIDNIESVTESTMTNKQKETFNNIINRITRMEELLV